MDTALKKHGAVVEFCRKTGFSRTTVDNWLTGVSFPNVKNLDTIAEGLGTTAWELLKPEGAAETPTHANEILEIMRALLSAKPNQIAAMKAALGILATERPDIQLKGKSG